MYNLRRLQNCRSSVLEDISYIEQLTFSDHWSMDHIKSEFSNTCSFSFVLSRNESVVGYIFSTKVVDEIQLNKICIHQKYRGMNIGTFLLGTFIEESVNAGAETILLEVNEQNNTARHLYEKAGFRTIRRRIKIYNSSHDGLEMALHLKSYTESPLSFSMEQLP